MGTPNGACQQLFTVNGGQSRSLFKSSHHCIRLEASQQHKHRPKINKQKKQRTRSEGRKQATDSS
eukprot:352836-Chlamydomonas_euryale.AAC.11